MTLDQLQDAIRETIAAGDIGVPVSLRLNVQTPSGAPSLITLSASTLPLIRTALGDRLSRVQARRHNSAEQLDVLMNFETGASALLTVGSGSVSAPEIRLLLFGNHGTARLEGMLLSESAALESLEESSDPWLQAIDDSLAR